MANKILWDAAYASQGTVLTTELNALANGSRTNAGTEFANQTTLARWAKVELQVDFVSAPSSGGYVQVYSVTAPDGTNYEDGSSTVDPGYHRLVCQIPLRADTASQRLTSAVFALEPAKTKFILHNASGQAFPATGSTLTLYTADDEIQ